MLVLLAVGRYMTPRAVAMLSMLSPVSISDCYNDACAHLTMRPLALAILWLIESRMQHD